MPFDVCHQFEELSTPARVQVKLMTVVSITTSATDDRRLNLFCKSKSSGARATVLIQRKGLKEDACGGATAGSGLSSLMRVDVMQANILQSRWSPPPMNTRNPRRVTNQCVAGHLDGNKISYGDQSDLGDCTTGTLAYWRIVARSRYERSVAERIRRSAERRFINLKTLRSCQTGDKQTTAPAPARVTLR
ncbi:hypothetical protein EVAR_8579_1 [Eumeta japonica]|uniref:Uncharacterized protein n=1 Tax=Eumeta variegata TaxID=151549 RepID=A0A4C1TXG6_EUMVA|nr:hypothetical protein EVAR_8579_1 [Eumeta japonica]